MSRRWLALLAIVITTSMGVVGWSVGRMRQSTAAPRAQASGAERGAFLFRVHCATCHGAEGRADGTSVVDLQGRPRDFASRPWHFEPTPASIRRVTLDGIPGTAMMSFRSTLSPADVDSVVAHVHELATREQSVPLAPGEEALLLREAGFTDLRGAKAPPLTVFDSTGNAVKLTSLKGKVVLLHFWGTGCVHCIKEMPALNDLQRSHPADLAVLHICADEDDSVTAQKFVDGVDPGTIAYTDPSGLAVARFEAQSLPTVWLIARGGEALARAHGARDWQSAASQKLIAHLLSRPQ